MLKISRQQALNRWDKLPSSLKEALFSEYNSKILWKICETQHLSENKISIVATLAGDVIFGFAHLDDLAKEIKEIIGINIEIANLIASEIDKKIFTPIKSEIEKVYAPVSETEEIEADRRGLESVEADLRGEEQSIPVEIKKPEAFMVSKVEPPIRIIGMDEDDQRPATSDQRPIIEKPKEKSEGPMIIHEETEFKPLSETKKSLKPLGGLFGFLSKKEKTGEVKPVRAEISGIDTGNEKLEMRNEEQKEIKSINTKIRTINYTEVPETIKQPTTDNKQLTTDNKQIVESPIEIIEEKGKIEMTEIIPEKNAPESSAVASADAKVLADKEAMADKPVIIHEETGQKPKKFFSGLSGFFLRKKIEAGGQENVIAKAKPEAISVNNEIASLSARNDKIEADKSRMADSSAGESPIKIIEKEIPKAEPEKIKITDIQLKPELPMKITEEINAPQLPVEKIFFRTLMDSSKSLFIEKKKEVHYKEEIKPTTDKR